MKAEQTRKLDAMTGVSTASGKTKGKKKKGGKIQSTEPVLPPPQDELPISLPSPPSGPGMRVIYQHQHLPTVVAASHSEVKAESSDTEEPGEAVTIARDGEDVGGESKGDKKEDTEDRKKKKVIKETPEDLISDTYNGAALDDYKWSQTMTDLDVKVPVAPGTKPKDVTVEIKNDHLKVVLQKPERKVLYNVHVVVGAGSFTPSLLLSLLPPFVPMSLTSYHPTTSFSLTHWISLVLDSSGCDRCQAASQSEG